MIDLKKRCQVVTGRRLSIRRSAADPSFILLQMLEWMDLFHMVNPAIGHLFEMASMHAISGVGIIPHCQARETCRAA